MSTFLCQSGGPIRGEIRVPGDKSISHRSIILSSIAHGKSTIRGFLQGEDSLNTLRSFKAMGVSIDQQDTTIIIEGAGLYGLRKPSEHLYVGNAGTGMRLMAGLLSGQSFDSVLTGDASLSKRPMGRVVDPLKAMGANIQTAEGGTAPLLISAAKQLHGIQYRMPMASAQVKSCLLLAGLYASGKTTVIEPAPTRDHSERMLKGFGVNVDVEGNQISLEGGQTLNAVDIDVPGDISSAAFFIVAALITKNSSLIIKHVGINPTRTGILDILKLMGAKIELTNHKTIGGEPVADIHVFSSQLIGIDIPEHLVPLAIDEFPVLFVAASAATGVTRLSGAEELRVKESDRIEVMAQGLSAIGVNAVATDDGMIIEQSNISGGEVYSHEDHRISMAFAVASLISSSKIVIHDCENVNTSFPGFLDLATSSGFNIQANMS